MENSHTLDHRQIKTRRALYDAFMSLLLEKNYDHISVLDITERAGVSRPTFYLHYNDKSELLMSRLKEFFHEFEMQHTKTGAAASTDSRKFRFFIHTMLDIIVRDPAFFHLVVSGNAGTIVNRAIRDEIELLLSRFIKTVYKSTTNPKNLWLTASFYAGGLQGIIFNWLEDGMKLSVDDLSDLLLHLFEEDYREILKPFPKKDPDL